MEKALAYHAEGRLGRLKVTPTETTETWVDLCRAHSQRVAEPCRGIATDPSRFFEYNVEGGQVAVNSNGGAIPSNA